MLRPRVDGTFSAVNSTPFGVPSTFYQAKGVIHSEQNIADAERRGLTLAFPREGAKQDRDGDRATIWDST